MEEKIIKARSETDAPAVVGARILKKDVYEAGLDAAVLLESARKQAQALIDDAQQRRDAIVHAAHEEGYRQGLARWKTRSAPPTKLRKRWTPSMNRRSSGWL